MDYYIWSTDNEYPVPGDEQRALAVRQQSGGTLIVRNAGAPPLDLGAQVATRRNLEFSAGQRSHRISTGSYTKA